MRRPERYSDGCDGQRCPSLEVHRRPIVGDDQELTNDSWGQSSAGSSSRVIRRRSVFSGKDDELSWVSVRHENRKTALTPRNPDPAKPAPATGKDRWSELSLGVPTTSRPLPRLPRLSKTKADKGDIEAVVGEFREFLETALDADGAEQSRIGEIR